MNPQHHHSSIHVSQQRKQRVQMKYTLHCCGIEEEARECPSHDQAARVLLSADEHMSSARHNRYTYLLSRLVEHLALSRQRLGPIHQIVNLLSTLQHRLDRFMLVPRQRLSLATA